MDEKIIWSIGFVLIVILLCVLKPNIGRIFLGIFYLIMAIGINIVNAITNPQSTIQMGEASLLKFYRTIFSEIVSKAPEFFILVIALFQITMGLLILNKHKKVKLGLIGTSIFLILITPFGYIQIPWLGIAAIQLYLLRKDFDKTFIEIIGSAFHR
ncbi:MAG: hypothetical protein PHR81_08800 [Bacteroidales bacterium]|jgi:hypothetical protein|nr:hypothetical protein [Bacteroidales bacterium]MDD4214894.1 hypothetical protein [Bacteroidales bacterium]